MQVLIKITELNGQQVVSARELHEFLESKRDFSNWIKDRIEKYGFVENQDFVLLNKIVEQTGRGGHNKIEYALTMDTAKEIAMVEGNEKGKQARRYFIECEKNLKQLAQNYNSEALHLKKIEILNNVMNTISNPLYKDTLSSIIIKEITGKEYLPLPKVEIPTFNATEICQLLAQKYNISVSPHKIGNIANKYKLKNTKNGIFVWDKSRYSHKQVQTFRYFEAVVDVFYKYIINN